MSFQLSQIKKFFRLLVFSATAVSFAMSIQGQSQTANQRGFKAGNSFSISDFETINTTNGNLMLNFPLAQLPSGRGGLNAGVFLTYQSKLFDTKTEQFRNSLFPCQGGGKGTPLICPYYKKSTLTVSDDGGWQIKSGYLLKFEDRRQEYQGVPEAERPYCGNGTGPGHDIMTYVHKLYVIFPDGSQHEMIPQGETDLLLDRFYRVRMDGLIENCGGSTTMTNAAMNYYSVDGSYVRMSVSYDGNQDMNDNTWTLYFPDGSRYESATKKGYDRNGNWIEFLPGMIRDQFGRTIFISTEQGTGDKLISSSGFNGEAIVWRIKYKSLAVTKKYNPWAEGGCTNPNCPPSTDPIPLNEQLVNVVDQLVLPTQTGGGLAYTFSYNAIDWPGYFPTTETAGFGELTGITLPEGAAATQSTPAQITYTYALDGAGLPAADRYTRETLKNRVTSKTVTRREQYDGTVSGPISETWNYSISETGAGITNPDGSTTSESFGRTSAPEGQTTSWDSGLGLASVGADGTLTEKIWSQNFPGGCPTNGCQSGLYSTNPYVKTEFTSLKSGGSYTLTSIKDYKYDKNGNVIEVKEYDWIPYATAHPGGVPTIPSGNTYLKRITKNDYFNSTPEASQNGLSDADMYVSSSNPRLLRLPQATEIQDANGTVRSRSEMDYDYEDYSLSNSIAGNLTETKSWDSTKNALCPPSNGSKLYGCGSQGSINYISTSTTYNSCGMPTSMRDARNVESRILYDSYGGSCGLYPISTVGAFGTPVARTTTTSHDFYTGLITLVVDSDNSNATTTTSYDVFGRSVLAIAPNGARTTSTYNDRERYVVTRSDVQNATDQKLVVTTFYDQLGRQRLSKTLEEGTPSQSDEVNEAVGIKVQTRYKISGNFSYQLVSNPYRASVSGSESADTMGWTVSAASNDGLQTTVKTFSGAALPGPWGSNSNSTGTVTTSRASNSTTVTDQAGKQRRSITNALGQLERVDEPDASGNLTQSTNYSYDTLGNLITVQQGAQNRFFFYSSLGRMIRVNQPEQDVNPNIGLNGHPTNSSWTSAVTYDDNGNVLTTTDAKNVVITNTGYDALNRPASRTYLYDGGLTPTVTFTYDETSVPNSRGKLTRVSNSLSETTYNGFDISGRLTSSTQRTPVDNETIATATPRTSSFEYNISGAITKQTYPSGRTVETNYDTDGDISGIHGKPTASAPDQTYVHNIGYFPDHKIQNIRLGNNLWETAKLNSRLQVTEIALGQTVNDGSLIRLQYEYGELQSNGIDVNGAANAGNIAKQTISFSGQSAPFVQTYRYDKIDRLTEATEKVNGTQSWQQTFGYDIYGNRNARYQVVGSNTLPINNLTLPSIDQFKNRYVLGQGYTYDSNGNITGDLDPATSQSRTFVFNGDNKQSEVKNSSNVTIGTYAYDGTGKRVKKITAQETTVFVYDGVGKLVAEYSTATPPQTPTIHYTATDMLGSPRVITDGNGQVESRRDFMPFGEELFADGVYRQTASKYSINGFDSVRQRFTGYQKDIETGLDFAEARMYQNVHGRFTAVDPLMASGKSANPQTFNRYTYTSNNPIANSDPTGLQAGNHSGSVYYKIMDNNAWAFSNKAGSGYNTKYEGRPKSIVGIDGYEYTIRSNGWSQGSKVAGAAFTPARPENSSSFVNHALIDSLASEGAKHEAIMFAAAAVGAGGGACAALCGPGLVASAPHLAATHGSLGSLAPIADFAIGFALGVAGEKVVNGSNDESNKKPMYGPFYRVGTSSEVENVLKSGLLWGRARRNGNYGIPAVQATHRGSSDSYEFWTTAPPRDPPFGVTHWYRGDPGVIDIDEDTVAIPVIVTATPHPRE